jgi:single-stranded-DNA-specific exonuclease
MSARGMLTQPEAKGYLESSPEDLLDPDLFIDMPFAVERIQSAIEEGEQIVIFGDYDADGITAVVLLLSVLQKLGANCSYYIPERSEGYGLTTETLTRLAEAGVTLLITVDTGITAFEEVEAAAEMGMDVIITDHHEAPEELPDAVAIIDPKAPGSGYPFPSLSGVGVAYKLASALTGDPNGILEEYAQLVAIGTVADVMPLVGENRYIVKVGIAQLQHTKNLGLAALLASVSNGLVPVTSQTIGFQIAPRINAAGRMGSCELSMRLFMVQDKQEAIRISQDLSDLNIRRRDIENIVFEQLSKIVLAQSETVPPAIVLSSEEWEPGVIGIVAGRLADRFNVPTFLITLKEDVGKGSARSFHGQSLVAALDACSDKLVSFGGHEMAAGFVVKKENIKILQESLEEFFRSEAVRELPRIATADCELDPNWISLDAVRELDICEPFGAGNPLPQFVIRNLSLNGIRSIGHGHHLKFDLGYDRGNLSAVWFSRNVDRFPFQLGSQVDVLVRLGISEFGNTVSTQIMVQDMRLTQESPDWRKFVAYQTSPDTLSVEELKYLLPDREKLAQIWRRLPNRWPTQDLPDSKVSLLQDNLCLARWVGGTAVPYAQVWIAIQAFAELGLLDLNTTEERQWRFIKHLRSANSEKVNLDASTLLKSLRQSIG